MPAKSEIKQGFWLMIGILLALFVVGVVGRFVMKAADLCRSVVFPMTLAKWR
jgi:hypothetical protein